VLVSFAILLTLISVALAAVQS